MATKKKNADIQTLDNTDDDVMNESNEEIEGTDTGTNTDGENDGTNGDGNDENTEAPQNPDEGTIDGENDGDDDSDGNDGNDAPIAPMGDGDDGDTEPLADDGDGDDGDEDDDTDYAENFKLRGTELSYPVRDVKAQDRIKELEAEVAELKSDLSELDFTTVSGTGMTIYYNKDIVSILLNTGTFNLSTSQSDNLGVLVFPSNVRAVGSRYFVCPVLQNWTPTTTIAYLNIRPASDQLDINILATQALSNAIIANTLTCPRSWFDIT